jgi:hypothetical protein
MLPESVRAAVPAVQLWLVGTLPLVAAFLLNVIE